MLQPVNTPSLTRDDGSQHAVRPLVDGSIAAPVGNAVYQVGHALQDKKVFRCRKECDVARKRLQSSIITSLRWHWHRLVIWQSICCFCPGIGW